MTVIGEYIVFEVLYHPSYPAWFGVFDNHPDEVRSSTERIGHHVLFPSTILYIQVKLAELRYPSSQSLWGCFGCLQILKTLMIGNDCSGMTIVDVVLPRSSSECMFDS